MLDDRDFKILGLLQGDADCSLDMIASVVNLSPSACARRIKLLKERRYIASHAFVLDRERMRLPTTAYVIVKTSDHSPKWSREFRAIVSNIPEILEVHQLGGEVDYILKVVLPSAEHWLDVHQKLVQDLPFLTIAAHISMRELKATTVLPMTHVGRRRAKNRIAGSKREGADPSASTDDGLASDAAKANEKRTAARPQSTSVKFEPLGCDKRIG